MADRTGRTRIAGMAAAAMFVVAGASYVVPSSPWGKEPTGPVQGSATATEARPAAAAARHLLDVPAIGVTTELMQLGLTAERELEVPPMARADTAGWYRLSPVPGDVGPAVIVGHVDSPSGPAVFHRLRELRAGDQVRVRRPDHRVAVFVVDRVATFDKDAFPTLEVYGPTPDAQLRLITCGGSYDRSQGGWQANTVVFARLHHLTPQKETA